VLPGDEQRAQTPKQAALTVLDLLGHGRGEGLAPRTEDGLDQVALVGER
jgi:hypothetical protein